MAAEIIKSGLIPVSNANFATNYQINDNTIGKFLSLNGARKFYNPGIGLTISSPSSGTTANSLQLENSITHEVISGFLNPTSNSNTAFFVYPDTMTPFGDAIPGLVNRPMTISDISMTGIQDLNSIPPQTSMRVFNVMQSGTYTFSVNSTLGQLIMTGDTAFSFDFAWFLNVNGNEILLDSEIINTPSQLIGTKNIANYHYSVPDFSQTYQLNVGDYVQLYSKGLAYISSVNYMIEFTHLDFIINLAVSVTPTQGTFSNPLNLTDFNTSFINFYGAGRDTLILKDNKLRS